MNNDQKPGAVMEYKNLTPDIKIPVLGLGTWRVGGGTEADRSQDESQIQAIQAAIRMGFTHIDTAEMYGAGHAEEIVGEAIKDFDREKLFITTKVSPEHLHYDDVISGARESLRRLQTDYIDLYLIHVPNPKIPVKETMRAFDSLLEEGFIRFMGVSNFSVGQLQKAQKHTRNKIVNNQIEYNLLIRNREGEYNENMEREIIPYCQENNILVTAYRPLVRGELAKPGFKLLDELAEKYNKTQAQIAINWLISKENIITVAKATNLQHLEENLGALGWRLSDEDMNRLDTEFPYK